ncbi:MAG: NAD(P)-dependent oxidoreductase [Erysipelotrichaceae bacterium]
MKKLKDKHVEVLDFSEVVATIDFTQAVQEAQRCLQCHNPLCEQGCPIKVPIKKVLEQVAMQELEQAYDTLLQAHSFPSICGRVCPQESQCEGMCVRKYQGKPISIGAIERFLGDRAKLEGWNQPIEVEKLNKSVGIVGSGPAGLACAYDLCKAGYHVTIYEALHEFGGVLAYGIPEFRLPKQLVAQELASLTHMGVVMKANTVVSQTLALPQLQQRHPDGIFLGSGAGLPTFMGILNEGLCGIFSANEILTRVNLMQANLTNTHTPLRLGKVCLVIGGGNVAIDAARVARRSGCQVYLVYRRTLEELPARKEEVLHAQQEGIQFLTLHTPIAYVGEDHHVVAAQLQVQRLGEVDASGRAKPIPTDTIVTVPCDSVIVAIGTRPNPLLGKHIHDLKTHAWGGIVVDEHGATSIDGVYAGGDAVSGAATVIKAMEAGKKAAQAIIKKGV